MPPLQGLIPQQKDKGKKVVGSTHDPQPLDSLNALNKAGRAIKQQIPTSSHFIYICPNVVHYFYHESTTNQS